jgi:uncharacterized membrane protein YkoI
MLQIPVGAAAGCDLLIWSSTKSKIKRSQPAAAPTGGDVLGWGNDGNSVSVKLKSLRCPPYATHKKYGDTMKTLTALSIAAFIGFTASLAHARDLGPDEALRLRDAGTIVSFEKLNATALAKHPGSTITDTELEEQYGKYIYQVEMRDPQGLEWDLELDAVTGQVLKDHQDT